MKTLKISAIALLTLCFTSVAFADLFHDPKVIIHGAQGGLDSPCPKCVPVGLKFSFTSPAKGQGPLFFTNASGKNWTSLSLVEMGVPAANISCGSSLFMTCSVTTLKSGAVRILFSGVKGGDNQFKGILAGQSFVIDFNCVHGDCWPKGGISFRGRAGTGLVTTPEPATLALLTTGVAGIFSRRRQWKRRQPV